MLQSDLPEFRWSWWRIFMQIRQRIFKRFTVQICLFSTAFWNFWRITRFSTTNQRWVINAQAGLVFFAHPVLTLLKHCLKQLSSNVQRSKRQLKQQTTCKNGLINARLHCWSTLLNFWRPI